MKTFLPFYYQQGPLSTPRDQSLVLTHDALLFKPTAMCQSKASYLSDFPLFLLDVENSLLLMGSYD